MNDSYLHKNLELFQRKNPSMAFRLRLETSAPIIESSQQSFDDTSAQVVFFSDLFSCMQQVEAALEKGCITIVVETDLGQAKRLMQQQDLHKLLSLDNFFWHSSEEFQEDFCLKLAWTYLFCSKAFFFKNKSIQSALEKAFEIAQLIACDYKDYGVKIVRNIFSNTRRLANSLLGPALNLSSAAIICGAGPSLDSVLPHIEDLHKNAWVFAGGSTLEVFAQHQLKLDVAAAVDPQLFIDLAHTTAFKFFYSLRCHPATAKSARGACYIFPGSGESLLEQKLWEAIFPMAPSLQESGWNVGNFMTTCALVCGCKHIVLAGMDMVYEQEREYVSSLMPRQSFKQRTEIVDKDGKKKITRDDFLAARDFYEQLIKLYPDVIFYQIGSSGLVIEGIQSVELAQLKGLLCTHAKQTNEIHAHKPSFEILTRFFSEFKASFERTCALCDLLLTKASIAAQQGKCLFALNALEEHELEQELFYQTILVRCWEIWQWKILQGLAPHHPQAFLKKLVFIQDVVKTYKNLFEDTQCLQV